MRRSFCDRRRRSPDMAFPPPTHPYTTPFLSDLSRSYVLCASFLRFSPSGFSECAALRRLPFLRRQCRLRRFETLRFAPHPKIRPAITTLHPSVGLVKIDALVRPPATRTFYAFPTHLFFSFLRTYVRFLRVDYSTKRGSCQSHKAKKSATSKKFFTRSPTCSEACF